MRVRQSDSWKKATSDADAVEPETMKADILKYQRPAEADKLLSIQKNLIDIKLIMHQNIEEVLKRGETMSV